MKTHKGQIVLVGDEPAMVLETLEIKAEDLQAANRSRKAEDQFPAGTQNVRVRSFGDDGRRWVKSSELKALEQAAPRGEGEGKGKGGGEKRPEA